MREKKKREALAKVWYVALFLCQPRCICIYMCVRVFYDVIDINNNNNNNNKKLCASCGRVIVYVFFSLHLVGVLSERKPVSLIITCRAKAKSRKQVVAGIPNTQTEIQ